MKKVVAGVLMTGLMLGAIQAQAATNVYSANVVGYVRTDTLQSNKLVLVGVPFVNVGDTNVTTLQDLFGGGQLRAAAFYTDADKVYLWNPLSQSYKYFAIKNTDGLFHNAQSVTTWGQAATNPVIRPGDGLWIKSPASVTGALDITVSGQVVSSSNSTTTIYPGMNLLSHQFSSGLDVNNSALTNAGVIGASFYTTADKIYVWDATQQKYNYWAMKEDDRKWHYANSVGQWGLGPVTNVIAPGQGFWFRRMTNVVYVWTEQSAYYNNLK